MRNAIAHSLAWLAAKVSPKAGPVVTTVDVANYRGGFVDSYKKHREPTDRDLISELKNTAWTCASINASVCASYPPKLYVRTLPSERPARLGTKKLTALETKALKQQPHLDVYTKEAEVAEVTAHPLLDLLKNVNSCHNAFDIWELTQFYLEVVGHAYWLIDDDSPFGLPAAIWPLPAHCITPRKNEGSKNIVDWYDYWTGNGVQKLDPEKVIHFFLPDPRNPFTGGLSPLRACFEQVALTSEYTAMRRAIYDNTGLPSVLISPADVVSEEEAERLETKWRQKFAKGGQGRALVAESAFKATVLSHSMGDLAALAEMKATKEDIANAFHVPIPYLTSETNMANMQATEHMHRYLAISPRLRRRDEKINEQLIPWYDDTGRLFVASEDPVPANKEMALQQQRDDLKMGIRSINEVREERGLPPVPWGELPFPPTPEGVDPTVTANKPGKNTKDVKA